jgi:hypothetical protein
VESGLQLGIDITATSEPALRISLKNAGSQPRDLAIGHEGTPDLYDLEFTAQAPGQQPQPVLDRSALKAQPGSFGAPITVHLQPGEVRAFLYPLSRLICVVNRNAVPLRRLLAQGYPVRASFDFPSVKLVTPELSLRPRR